MANEELSGTSFAGVADSEPGARAGFICILPALLTLSATARGDGRALRVSSSSIT